MMNMTKMALTMRLLTWGDKPCRGIPNSLSALSNFRSQGSAWSRCLEYENHGNDHYYNCEVKIRFWTIWICLTQKWRTVSLKSSLRRSNNLWLQWKSKDIIAIQFTFWTNYWFHVKICVALFLSDLQNSDIEWISRV